MKKMTKKERKEFLLVVFAFICGTIASTLWNYALHGREMNTKSNTQVYEKTSLATSIEKIRDAVVTIETYDGDYYLSTGTGFVYKKGNKKAYVLTNEHVMDGNVIKIITSKNEIANGKLLGKDAYLDLAVIEIDEKYAEQIAIIGTSENMKVGDTVFTVGAPIGRRYSGSASAGIISGKDRIVQTTVSGVDDIEWVMKVLQFDAAINPGNSGGPLMNVNGEVIGICTMKLIKEDIEGMAFATPIEDALSFVETLEKGEKIIRPTLGAVLGDIESALYDETIKIPEDQTFGAVVLKVEEKGNAIGKLKKGDIIAEIEGIKVDDEIYVFDAGIKFASGNLLGIDYIMPDFHYLFSLIHFLRK